VKHGPTSPAETWSPERAVGLRTIVRDVREETGTEATIEKLVSVGSALSEIATSHPATYARSPESCSIRRMTCQECSHEASGRAEGWAALLVDLDDDGQAEVVFYNPSCAAREFHCSGNSARTSTGSKLSPNSGPPRSLACWCTVPGHGSRTTVIASHSCILSLGQ